MPHFLKSLVLLVSVTAYDGERSLLLPQSAAPAFRVPAEVGPLFPEALQASRAESVLSDQPATDTVAATPTRGNHTWEAGAIGAVSLGLVSVMRSRALCNDNVADRNCTSMMVGRFLMSALVGGVAGLFIGSGIPKHGVEPDTVEADPRQE